MSEDVLFSSFGNLTLVLLVIALGIFIWLTASLRKNIRTFQFQISVFILIWIIGEILDLLGEEGVVEIFSTSDISIYVHTLAMAMFSAMLWMRFYLSQKRGKKIADAFQEG